jgi:hypothetical protein
VPVDAVLVGTVPVDAVLLGTVPVGAAHCAAFTQCGPHQT